MRNIILLLVACAISISLFGQKMEFIPHTAEPHFCPLLEGISSHYVPPRSKMPYTKSKTTFEATYIGDMPVEAQVAFDHTLNLLRGFLSTSVPIRVLVSWEQRDADNLAAASPDGYYIGGLSAPFPNRGYPTALMEKISQTNLNGDSYDINVFINSTVDWNYELNPSDIGSQADFVGTMMHEILHGVGFTAQVFYNEDNDLGFYNAFTENRHSAFADRMRLGSNPLDNLEDASLEMGNAFTSQNLFFERINLSTLKLYAPPVYDGGSSVSHLDQNTYANTPNSMMGPSAVAGKIERDPGEALEMLYDLGWDHVYFDHTPEAGSEDFNVAQAVEVGITADSDIIPGTTLLSYSLDSFATKTSVELTLNAATGMYEGALPAPEEAVTYQYFFETTNSRDVTFSNPGDAPDFYYQFIYAIDNLAPFVFHSPPKSINNKATSLLLEANVEDDLFGVDSVTVEWFIGGISQIPVLMVPKLGFDGEPLGNDFEGNLVFPNGPLDIGVVISYAIFATDKSKSKNTGKSPIRGADWMLTVEEVVPSIITYINEFESPSVDFVSTGFAIQITQGFTSSSISTTHPYPEGGANNSVNLISELNVPITISADNPLIEFDEVAIVEIGEPNTVFGDDEFWDYVIVEGKKVGTNEWLPFLDGYDSNADPQWLARYNSAPLTASSSLYRSRIINMTTTGAFNAGDEVFIRFRLFSDPSVNAWGWGLDNLEIQKLSTAVSDFVIKEDVRIYPNPVTEQLNLEIDLLNQSDDLRIEIVDYLGRVMHRETIGNSSYNIRKKISVSELPDGMYLLNIYFNNRDVLTKKFVKD